MFPIRDENPKPPGFKPKVTYALIMINIIVFFFEVAVTGQFFEFSNNRAAALFYEWGAVPACIMGESSITIQQIRVSCPDMPMLGLLSSVFLHGGLMHLGGNMLFLWIFGDNIELKFGRAKYLGIYLVWGIIAGLAHVVGDMYSPIPAVGASGAISGVLGAYLVMFPRAKVTTFLMMGFFWRMLHVPAKWYLPFWLLFQNVLPFLIGGFGFGSGGVAYLAHIGGFAIGLATGYLYKKTHRPEYMYGSRYGWRGD
ncbi:rhomboid family intramembrane serine protease [Candidatus Nitrosotenuis uzonensis]|uniref:Rhomboid family protein n=1 Tax=Candidatus Nitrosotenuis uzonensis TaxID=1407055 RepID=A0A812F3R0_9ARCH|nr:rhomboid family intramembrane serine protease [Candidatus Nitrosotenuis uzonensis]CAE6492194.1 Rhomboid family protein [Candidatus Nitrosotenuis uzonensis]